MSDYKLGDVSHCLSGDFILTSLRHIPSCHGGYRVETWTPIPDGMTAEDLGRKFMPAQTAVLLQPVPLSEDYKIDPLTYMSYCR